MDEFEKRIAFILELDKMKSIARQTYLADGSRAENDAEHCWHLALMAIVFADCANRPVDLLKTVTMALLHDAVEIDAGDTYAYDEAANATRCAREQRAADRIFGLLPEEQGARLRALWEEFEAGQTPEARFAGALDKIQPLLLNDASGGKSWREHGVKRSQVLARNQRTHEGSETLWRYALSLIEKNTEQGNLSPE